MKTLSWTFLLLVPFAATIASAEVKLGASLNEVRTTLGLPRGQTVVGNREIFYYDRGEVEVRAGVVTRVALRSAEDQAAFESRRAAEAVRVREDQEIRRARLSAEGEELKARKMADPAFQLSPLPYQVAFWEDFSRRYPDIPSAQQLSEVRLKLAAQVTEIRSRAEEARKLAELEARVAAAEAEARENRANAFYTRHYYYPSDRDYAPRYDRTNASSKIETHLYEFPIPATTSPGMPPMQPVYRKEPNPLIFPFPNQVDPSNPGRDSSSNTNDDHSNARRDHSDSRRY